MAKLFSTRGPRSLSFGPAFLPFFGMPNPWIFDGFGGRCTAAGGMGWLPLQLAEGATLLSVRIQGNSAEVYFTLYRHQTPTQQGDLLFNTSFIVSGGVPTDFDSLFAIDTSFRFNIVDNTRAN